MQIAVVANTSWYLYNFRLNLMHALKAIGHGVVAVGPSDEYVKPIMKAGFQHEMVPFSGDGINPLRELGVVLLLKRKLSKTNSKIVLSFTPKGNIYSGLAGMTLNVKTIPNVSGLGRVFIRHSLLTSIVKSLYKLILRKSYMVFFQNEDDLRMFVREGLVEEFKAKRIPGSGVDLDRFQYPFGNNNGDREPVNFLLAGRLLWDKGVGEFVEAARMLKTKYPSMKSCLLGFLDVENPSALSRSQIERWQSEGVVEYIGATDDVRPYFADADCIVLPSYREGTPRTMLEAASMSRPIITTDTAGCRDTVEDGKTGFLCKPKDASDLANKMERMLNLSPEQRAAMGRAGRKKMEKEFDERIVIDRYLQAIEEIASNQPKMSF